jgi:hypothetical protein
VLLLPVSRLRREVTTVRLRMDSAFVRSVHFTQCTRSYCMWVPRVVAYLCMLLPPAALLSPARSELVPATKPICDFRAPLLDTAVE